MNSSSSGALDYRFIAATLVAYFVMNILFAVRLMRVLRAMGYQVGFWRALAAQYGGMLASDFTPARSGYLITPVLLDSRIPLAVGTSAILSIQSAEFFVKAFGAALGVLFLVYALKGGLLSLALLGAALMVAGGAAILFLLRSERPSSFAQKLPFLKRFASKFLEAKSATGRLGWRLIAEIVLFTIVSWVVKGFEWYFIGLALGMDLGFFAYFLLHPLVTALSFVPLTPSGIGFQEGAAVGMLYLLGIPLSPALMFAILSRVLLILEDLAGIYPISQVGFKAVKAALSR